MQGIVVDLEWDGNDPDKRLMVVGIGNKAYACDSVGNIPLEAQSLLLQDTDKITFTKEDHRMLARLHYGVGGNIIDVQTMAWCYDETTPLSLDWCSKHYCGHDPDKRLVRNKGKIWFRCNDGGLVLVGDAPIEELMEYNQRDLEATANLANELERRLRSTGMFDYWEKKHKPLSPVLLQMELNGLPIDIDAAKELGGELTSKAAELDSELRAEAYLPDEFNLNSKDQIALLLFTRDFTLPGRIRVTKEEMKTLKEGTLLKRIPLNFDIQKLGRDYITGEFDLHGFGMKPKIKAPKCKEKTCGHPLGECKPSVASKTLKVYHSDNPWVERLIDYRMYDKALQFVAVWLRENVDGRLYTHFKQTGTATGRLSSSDPVNLQNIPSRGELGPSIRGLFRAPEGFVFVNGDYSQIEPRLMAHFSEDKEMIRVFEAGLDLYEEATVSILGIRYPKGTPERQLIRTCFLAMGYGAQPPKIRSNLAEEGFRFSLAKVEKAHSDMINLYNGFWDWKDECVEEARENRYVTTIGGHRRHLAFGGGGSWKAERQAVNTMMQGSAADIINDTMVLCSTQMPSFWNLILQVHDELMWQVSANLIVPDDLSKLRWLAEEGHGYVLKVPIVFKPQVAATWAEAK